MTHSNDTVEYEHLKRRGRRRLVGAIALVIFALIVLWTALDSVPPQRFSSGHPVEIVSSVPALMAQKASVVAVVEPGSAAMLRPPVDAAPAALVSSAVATELRQASMPVAVPVSQAARQASSVLPGKLVNRQSAPAKVAPAPVVKPKPAENSTATFDPKKILDGQVDPTVQPAKPVKPAGKYYVQIGAFADAAKVKQLTAKLKAAGLPVLTEKLKSSNGELTRVRVGPAPDEERANAYRKKLESVGISGKVTK